MLALNVVGTLPLIPKHNLLVILACVPLALTVHAAIRIAGAPICTNSLFAPKTTQRGIDHTCSPKERGGGGAGGGGGREGERGRESKREGGEGERDYWIHSLWDPETFAPGRRHVPPGAPCPGAAR
jgi:hypothetical protein